MRNIDEVRRRVLSVRGTRMLGAVALAAAGTLAACGGGDGPTGIRGSVLDANAIGASANKLQAVVSQPVLAAIISQGASSGVPTFDRGVARMPRLLPRIMVGAARLVPDTRAALGARARSTASHATITGFTAAIPDSLLGKTLVPDPLGTFSINSGLTGAPVNGVRFIVRTLGTTQDLGYADLTQSVSGATTTLTLDVKTTAGAVLMHNVETTTTSGSNANDGFTGYVTNGTDRVDYSITAQTTGARTVAYTTVTAPSASVALADTTVVDGMAANDVDVVRLTVGTSTVRLTTAAMPDGSGGFVESDTTNITANGAPFARVVVDASGTPRLTGPNGGSLSASDQQALYAVETVLAGAAYTLLAPLTVAFWLYIVTGGL